MCVSAVSRRASLTTKLKRVRMAPLGGANVSSFTRTCIWRRRARCLPYQEKTGKMSVLPGEDGQDVCPTRRRPARCLSYQEKTGKMPVLPGLPRVLVLGRNCGKTVAARCLSPFSTAVRNSPSEKGDRHRRQTRNSGKNQSVTEPVPIFGLPAYSLRFLEYQDRSSSSRLPGAGLGDRS